MSHSIYDFIGEIQYSLANCKQLLCVLTVGFFYCFLLLFGSDVRVSCELCLKFAYEVVLCVCVCLWWWWFIFVMKLPWVKECNCWRSVFVSKYKGKKPIHRAIKYFTTFYYKFHGCSDKLSLKHKIDSNARNTRITLFAIYSMFFWVCLCVCV